MAILDCKIADADYTGRDVASLPDEPSEAGMSATALKGAFDRLTKEVVAPKHNSLVEALAGTTPGESGAKNISADAVESGAGTNVQSNLNYLLEKLNVHLAAPVHIAFGSEIPMPEQPANAIWIQEQTEVPGNAAAVIRNATVSESEISNKENIWLDT